MKVEVKEIPATKEYILIVSREEAMYITELLNCAPSKISVTLGLKEYTPSVISKLIGHGGNGMCKTLRTAIYGD